MKELPYKNSTKNDMHLGGKIIKSGATEMVEATQHPDYHKLMGATDAPQTSTADKRTAELKDLLETKGGMPKVLEAIGNGATFTTEDLQQLKALEAASKSPRKGLMNSIDELLLQRAKDASQGGGEGILGMLEGEDVAAGITAADDLTAEDLGKLEQAETAGKQRADVLLAIQGKVTEMRTATAKGILAQVDVVAAITDSKDLVRADLELLEQLEINSESPRDLVADAIKAKLATLKDAPAKPGILGGLFGRKR